MRPNRTFKDELLMIDGIALKKRIIIPDKLQQQALEQLHVNDMGIEQMRPLL